MELLRSARAQLRSESQRKSKDVCGKGDEGN